MADEDDLPQILVKEQGRNISHMRGEIDPAVPEVCSAAQARKGWRERAMAPLAKLIGDSPPHPATGKRAVD